jgi:hypothetical protein
MLENKTGIQDTTPMDIKQCMEVTSSKASHLINALYILDVIQDVNREATQETKNNILAKITDMRTWLDTLEELVKDVTPACTYCGTFKDTHKNKRGVYVCTNCEILDASYWLS